LITFVKVKTERSERGRQFVLFLFFISFYIGAIIMQSNPYNTQSMIQGFKDHFVEATYRDVYTFELKKFEDTVTLDDLWMWIQQIFAERIYVENYYNGDPLNGTAANTLLMHNRITKGFRMTQRRVLNGSNVFCIEREEFELFAPNCYGRTFVDSRLGDVDEAPFYSPDGKIRYDYEEIDAGFGTWYDIDVGYFQVFGFNREVALERLKSLRTNAWINEGTAWLRLDFVTFNANTGLFAHVKFVFDLKNTGEIESHFQAETLSAEAYGSTKDIARAALELMATCLWFYFLVKMVINAIQAARRTGKVMAHFNSFDTVAELLQALVFLVIFVLWMIIVNYPVRDEFVITQDEISDESGNQPNFASLAYHYHNYYIFNACNIHLALMRILSYMRINPNISQLTETFANSRKNIAQFGIVLLLLILCFQLMAHLMFGSSLKEFASFDDGFVATVQIMLGAGSYYDLSQADKVAAPLFYYPFVFIMILIVFNMTIAIIMDGYDIAQEERRNAQESQMQDLNNKNVFVQFGSGLMRILAPIKGCVPKRLRMKKMESGEEYDRYKVLDKRQTLSLLEPLSLKTRYHDFTDFHEAVNRAAGKEDEDHERISREDLIFIIDRYQAWENLDAYDAEREEEKRMKAVLETTASLEKLHGKVATMLRNQQQMNIKVDMIMRSLVVTERERC